MTCPRQGCNLPGRRYFSGYCTKVHWQLDQPSKKVRLNCATCGTVVVRNRSEWKDGAKAYCKRCPKNSGESHPNWKEGQYINASGYRVVLRNGTYKLEHRVAWEEANRACILPWLHSKVAVHHIDMNKLNNHPRNLVLLPSEIHGRVHRLIDAERYEEATCELIRYLEQQLYFVEHTEHLDFIRNTSLQDILNLR